MPRQPAAPLLQARPGHGKQSADTIRTRRARDSSRGEENAVHDEGSRDFSGAVRRRCRAVQRLPSIAKWAAGLGYKGVQIPTWDARLFDLEKAAKSKAYCDEVKGICKDAGVEITELSTHLQGQLVAVHPAYDTAVRRALRRPKSTTIRRPGRNGRSSR